MAMMLQRFLLTAGLLALGCDASFATVYANQTFAGFMTRFEKNYAEGSAEYAMRESLFHKRLAEILAHNSAGHSWEMVLNQFTDWNEGELLSLRGYKRQHREYTNSTGSMMEIQQHGDMDPAYKPEHTPASATEFMDWVSEHNSVKRRLQTAGDVFNQGPCGSCWAVGATATVQLHAAMIEKKFNLVLSPENINRCAPNPLKCGGEGGCQGSTPEKAFQYLVDLSKTGGGLYPKTKLPYTAKTEMEVPEPACSKTGLLGQGQGQGQGHPFLEGNNLRSSTAPVVSIGGWEQVKMNDAGQVMDRLMNKGPLAVAVVGAGIQGYGRGVISNCASTQVDHAVVMTGWGHTGGNDQGSNTATSGEQTVHYWNMRNSWGHEWGENGGYFRVKRNPSGEPCAWDNHPEKGVACQDAKTGKYPTKTWVCGTCGIISDVAYPTGVKVHPSLLQ